MVFLHLHQKGSLCRNGQYCRKTIICLQLGSYQSRVGLCLRRYDGVRFGSRLETLQGLMVSRLPAGSLATRGELCAILPWAQNPQRVYCLNNA